MVYRQLIGGLFVISIIFFVYSTLRIGNTMVGMHRLTLCSDKRCGPIYFFYPIRSTMTWHMSFVWQRPFIKKNALFTDPLKRPLIVMSHGFKGSPFELSWLIVSLVNAGYYVASVEQVGTSLRTFSDELAVQLWQQPIRVSHLLDYLLGHEIIGSHIMAEAIGFVGYSQGGMTGLWLAGATLGEISSEEISRRLIARDMPLVAKQFFMHGIADDLASVDMTPGYGSYADPRIRAFFLLAPGLTWLFSDKSVAHITPPTMILATRGDRIVPFPENAARIAQLNQRIMVEVVGNPHTDHFVFLHQPTWLGQIILPSFITHDTPVVRQQVHTQVRKRAITFFDHWLTGTTNEHAPTENDQ